MELTKIAFVDVASGDFGIRKRSTNTSRVAIITGLTRKEVRRIKIVAKDPEPFQDILSTHPQRVCETWRREKAFTSDNGSPRPLSFNGPGSFVELCKKTVGDIPPGALRTELKRLGLIAIDSDGVIALVDEAPEAVASPADLVLLNALTHAATAVNHNLDPTSYVQWPIAIVSSHRIARADLDTFRKLSTIRIEKSKQDLAGIFNAFEVINERSGGVESGVLMVHFESDEVEK